MLKTVNISLSYDSQKIFSNISLNISKGEIVCLCGESGCGKSSLLKAIQGFAESTGLIEVDGDILDENTVDTIRQKTAYVPQDLSLPYDTVEQMVMSLFELRVNRNIKFSKDSIFADWALLGLDNSLWNKQVNEISGGQRQRIMLTIAGLTGKQLLLADEPTSALDSESALLVAKYFRMLAKERNMAILAVSHSEVFAKECDRVIKL
jgi:ABC-type multidrug transport system ATPase subunit